jgi:hypothetical protein
VLVLIGTTAYLLSGRFVMAGVTAVVELAPTAFLAVVTHAMVTPLSHCDTGWRPRADAARERGRRTLGRGHHRRRRRRPPGTIRLDIVDESVSINARAWSGVRDFVILVARTPHAADRLTPSALQEWLRLLGVTQVEPVDE